MVHCQAPRPIVWYDDVYGVVIALGKVWVRVR